MRHTCIVNTIDIGGEFPAPNICTYKPSFHYITQQWKMDQIRT